MIYLNTPNGIYIKDGESSKTIHSDNPKYADIVINIKQGNYVAVRDLAFSVEKAVQNSEVFTVQNGVGEDRQTKEVVPEFILRRLNEHIDNKLEVKSIENFWDKLKHNPREDCRKTLLDFLEKNHLPLFPSGDILGFKGIREDYTDGFTGKIDMSIGSVLNWESLFPNIPIEYNVNKFCDSSGFHIGSWEYSRTYSQKQVECLFDPRDVLVVPLGSESFKIRVKKFIVLRESRFDSADKIPYLVNN